jgi:hypothetical protein
MLLPRSIEVQKGYKPCWAAIFCFCASENCMIKLCSLYSLLAFIVRIVIVKDIWPITSCVYFLPC